ncbi:MAG: AAA family ATPase [Crocinitomix sp.]|nr:AAA family ATPase [Crocinitomix sp.]
MKNCVFLIGFMGAGKSRLGKRLSKRMNYSFLDADQEIEKENDATIEQLFDLLGEEGFRTLETNWLQDLDAENTIISLGGGTPCFNDNMSLILEKGKSVYLQLEPKVLLDRLQNAKGIRPLIEPIKDDKEALLTFIEEKLKDREDYYNMANYTTKAMSLSAKRLDDLIEAIERL